MTTIRKAPFPSSVWFFFSPHLYGSVHQQSSTEKPNQHLLAHGRVDVLTLKDGKENKLGEFE